MARANELGRSVSKAILDQIADWDQKLFGPGAWSRFAHFDQGFCAFAPTCEDALNLFPAGYD